MLLFSVVLLLGSCQDESEIIMDETATIQEDATGLNIPITDKAKLEDQFRSEYNNFGFDVSETIDEYIEKQFAEIAELEKVDPNQMSSGDDSNLEKSSCNSPKIRVISTNVTKTRPECSSSLSAVSIHGKAELHGNSSCSWNGYQIRGESKFHARYINNKKSVTIYNFISLASVGTKAHSRVRVWRWTGRNWVLVKNKYKLITSPNIGGQNAVRYVHTSARNSTNYYYVQLAAILVKNKCGQNVNYPLRTMNAMYLAK